MMDALRMLVGCGVRRRWRALMALALATALGGGFLLTVWTGARRIDTVWPRFEDATLAPELIGEFPEDAWRGVVDDLEARPDVQAVSAITFMFVYPEGRADLKQMGSFVGLTPSFGMSIYVPRVLDGRLADPSRVDELTINSAMAALSGLRVGDEVTLVSDPEVVLQRTRVVGVHQGVFDVGTNVGASSALLTPAFADRWYAPWVDALSAVGGAGPLRAGVMVRLGPDADLGLGSPGSPAASAGDPLVGLARFEAPEVTDALATQRDAYLILLAVAGLAIVTAIVQAGGGVVRRDIDQIPALGAIGLRRSEQQVVVAGPVVAALLGGLLLAPAVGLIGSTLVPTGFAGSVEPDPGIHADGLVLLSGPVALAAMLVGMAWVSAHRMTRRLGQGNPASGTFPAPLRRPGALVGWRSATGWGTRSGRVQARGTVAATAAATALVMAVNGWSSSSERLQADPHRYGWAWDAFLAEQRQGAGEELAAAIEAGGPHVDAVIARSTRADVGALDLDLGASIAGTGEISVLAIDPSHDSLWPPLIRGRVPSTAFEVIVGGDALTTAQLDLGDEVASSTGEILTVVGEAVIPELGNGSFGSNLAMPLEGAVRAGARFDYLGVLVDLAPGATVDDLELIGTEDTIVSGPFPPPGVLNLGLIGRVDLVVAALVALAGSITLLHGLWVAGRARRRDHAVLRALGGRRRLVAEALAWHGALITVTGVAIGVPVGLVAGRLAWQRTARDIGVLTTFSPGWTSVVVVVLTALGAALAATAVLVLAARRVSTIEQLRVE